MHNAVNRVDVDPTRCYIGRDEYVRVASGKGSKCSFALRLASVAVNSYSAYASSNELAC